MLLSCVNTAVMFCVRMFCVSLYMSDGCHTSSHTFL